MCLKFSKPKLLTTRSFIAIYIMVTLPGQVLTKQNCRNCLLNKNNHVGLCAMKTDLVMKKVMSMLINIFQINIFQILTLMFIFSEGLSPTIISRVLNIRTHAYPTLKEQTLL